ncbi:hypothetical protein LCGC14_0666720 [marine sediment metagenome]|uniref:Uncharacterized protein n=1 Tax=marine sediment metagenome TaxID=412755 RepID=A0A0F9U093_9ZZZZ
MCRSLRAECVWARTASRKDGDQMAVGRRMCVVCGNRDIITGRLVAYPHMMYEVAKHGAMCSECAYNGAEQGATIIIVAVLG